MLRSRPTDCEKGLAFGHSTRPPSPHPLAPRLTGLDASVARTCGRVLQAPRVWAWPLPKGWTSRPTEGSVRCIQCHSSDRLAKKKRWRRGLEAGSLRLAFFPQVRPPGGHGHTREHVPRHGHVPWPLGAVDASLLSFRRRWGEPPPRDEREPEGGALARNSQERGRASAFYFDERRLPALLHSPYWGRVGMPPRVRSGGGACFWGCPPLPRPQWPPIGWPCGPPVLLGRGLVRVRASGSSRLAFCSLVSHLHHTHSSGNGHCVASVWGRVVVVKRVFHRRFSGRCGRILLGHRRGSRVTRTFVVCWAACLQER